MFHFQGPSRCGKSYNVGNMLKNLKHAAKEIPELVIYVYSTWQSKYDEFLHLVDYFIEDDNDLEKNIKK